MSFKKFYNAKLDEEIEFDFSDIDIDALIKEEGSNPETIDEKVKTELDRKKIRAKKDARKLATKGQFDKWDIQKRAQFMARFEYKAMSPTKGRYVKRKNPLNTTDVVKQLKKAGKRMKRLMKSKGKLIAKKSARIKASHGR